VLQKSWDEIIIVGGLCQHVLFLVSSPFVCHIVSGVLVVLMGHGVVSLEALEQLRLRLSVIEHHASRRGPLLVHPYLGLRVYARCYTVHLSRVSV
jgi:hypothetical protein